MRGSSPRVTPARVTQEIDRDALRAVLDEIAEHDAGHRWSSVVAGGRRATPADVAALLDEEQALRPTRFVFLWGDGGDLIGVGTYALKVRHAFPFDGFPVIARAFVRPRYRSQGHYRSLLAARVAACREEVGEALRGIHLGTSNPAVVRAASAFRVIGEQRLHGSVIVTAYLAFSAGLAGELVDDLRAVAPACGEAASLAAIARQIPRHGIGRRGYDVIHALAQKLEAATGFQVRSRSLAWNQLFALLEAIPVIHGGPP